MYIGQSIPSPDATERLTGRIPFLTNLALPGMLYAKVLRSPYPHARILAIDTSEAEALPGVVAVFSRNDLDLPGAPDPYYGSVLKDHQLVALEKVRYVGDVVAIVAAEDAEIAEAALDYIVVEYEELPTVYDALEAAKAGAPLIHEGLVKSYNAPPKQVDSNTFRSIRVRYGNVDESFAAADKVYEHTFSCPTAHHAALEPHVAVAQFDGPRLLIYSATQAPFKVRDKVAAVFDMRPEDVRIIVPPVGGGFGAKSHLKLEGLVAAIARKTEGRPVRLVLTRAESFTQITKHAASVTLRTGVMRDGTLVARKLTIFWNAGAYSDTSPIVAKNGAITGFGPYRWQHAWADSHAVYTNLPPAGSFRGPAVIEVTWAGESQIDIIANDLGLDPVAFRLQNLLRDGDTFITGETMHGMHYEDLLQSVVARLGSKSSNSRRGIGVAVTMKSTTTPSTSKADIRLDADGSVNLLSSTVDLGQGSKITLSQIAADALGISMEKIRIVDPDSAVTPFDQATNSSRSTFSMGNALSRAADHLKQELKRLAVELWEVHADDLIVSDQKIAVRGSPEFSTSWAGLLNQTGLSSLLGTAEFTTTGGLDANNRGIATVHWHQGAGAATVEVDRETGRTHVVACHAATYAGRVINPATASLQSEGNIIMGLGVAMAEEIHFDSGQVVNGNLGDYLIPSLLDVPVDLTTIEAEDKSGSGVIHGVAESTIATIAPAIGNAVAAATGVRIMDLPITPEKVLRALRIEQ